MCGSFKNFKLVYCLYDNVNENFRDRMQNKCEITQNNKNLSTLLVFVIVFRKIPIQYTKKIPRFGLTGLATHYPVSRRRRLVNPYT